MQVTARARSLVLACLSHSVTVVFVRRCKETSATEDAGGVVGALDTGVCWLAVRENVAAAACRRIQGGEVPDSAAERHTR